MGRSHHSIAAWPCLLLASAVWLLACSTKPSSTTEDSGTGVDGSQDGHVEADASDAAPACITDSYPGKRGVALHLLLDRSASMQDETTVGGDSKWEAAVSAVKRFAADASSDDLDLGLVIYGLPIAGGACTTLSCTGDGDCGPAACGPCNLVAPGLGFCAGFDAESCDASDYATPAVAIAPRDDVSAAFTASLDAHSPDSDSVLGPPLQGGLTYAADWAAAHPGTDASVVLLTDSEPSVCDTDIAQIASLAADALAGSPSIATFLVELGSDQSALDPIADSGGRSPAFVVPVDSGFEQAVLDALLDVSVRARRESCRYPLTVGAAASVSRFVRTRLTPEAIATDVAPVASDEACTIDGGFYVDGDAVRLCPATCDAVRASATSSVDVLHGCDAP